MIKKKIISGTAINAIGKALSFALQMFIVTYLIKTLGKETYGIVVLALALVANTNLLEAGFGLSVTKYVAEYKAKGEWEKLLEVVNTNFVVSVVLALIFSAILLVVNEFFLEKIFMVPPHLLNDTKTLIRILVALSVIEFLSVNIIRIAEGFQKYAHARFMELLKWILRTAFVVIAVEKGHGLIGIGVAYLCAGIISAIALYLFVFFRDSNLRLSPRLCTVKAFKHLFGFSVWIFMSKIFSFLSYRIDTILIGMFLSPVYLTYYSVAFKIYEFLKFGFSLLASTLLPVSSELNALMDKKRLSLLFLKASKYTVTFISPFLVFSLFYVDKIIPLWVGEGFEVSFLLAQLFITSLFFIALIANGTEIMIGLNMMKELVVYSGVGSIVNLLFSVILIKKIGVYGVVVGTLIGTCIITAGCLYQMLARFNTTFITFAKDVIVKTAGGLIIFSLVILLFPHNLYYGIALTMFYLILLVLFAIDREDKKDFLKLFNTKKWKLF